MKQYQNITLAAMELIKQMNHEQVVELTSALCVYFNLSDAVSSAQQIEQSADAEDAYVVKLLDVGNQRISVVKSIKEYCVGISLLDAKILAENAPILIDKFKHHKLDEARRFVDSLASVGARAELFKA
jgi:ribosomal protein L7/L12